ncbi:MAG: DUF3570 domain-containing protein [Candidatus Eisenbacteria bacterium]|nr:DUF3570 domain-containing protein [Candidatus Eisenbacteria bacterium]
MQLEAAPRGSRLRTRLGAAACLLLASSAAHAQAPDSTANTLEASTLLYGENKRTNVLEPAARFTHLFGGGQILSAELGLDVMTGATPTGARASNQVQTVTSASGSTSTSGTEIPTAHFKDARGVFDLGLQTPLGRLLRAEAGAHVSREKDYRSLGGTARLSADLFQRLVTVSAGGGYDDDGVFPVGGTPEGLTIDRGVVRYDVQPKRVETATVGISRILTRRWMVSLDASRTRERGYLTEPYKIVTIVTSEEGIPVATVTEKRPATRVRRSLLGSSVYHLEKDILYLTYRYYWDDWGLRSHTADARYRIELPAETFLQPHVRFYTQSAADLFTFGLRDDQPLPPYASSDQRLGPLRSVTLGATVGFRVPSQPGRFTLRAEWIHQWGRVGTAGGIQSGPPVDLFPPLEIGTLVAGYSVGF